MDKNIYIVEQSDLIGQIANFPIEVVQKMVERQYDQNGRCDVSIFQFDRSAGHNGFCWSRTPEGIDFWSGVISSERWDIFFNKFPELQNNCTFVVVDEGSKWMADVKRMQQYSCDKRRFAYKNKVGDIYYIDVDRHGDRRVRFALANSTLAKEVIESGVKFGDTTNNLDTEVKSEDASDSTNKSLSELYDEVSFTMAKIFPF